MYVSILAAETANVALKFLALGGVYLGGGVPPKIRQMLVEPLFMERFTMKYMIADLMKRIPVHVILNDNIGLRGGRPCTPSAWRGSRHPPERPRGACPLSCRRVSP